MTTGAEAACVVCGEPAHNKCGACKLDTSSQACKDIQNANLEKKLTRLAAILQQGYYDFRKNTWDRRIVKVERLRNDDLVLHEADRVRGINAKYFLQFPQKLVPDKRTGNAVLCLHVKIEEVSVDLKPPPHKVILHYTNGEGDSNYPRYHHEIIRVTSTKTKKAWVMDISGAQYGIYRALWSWQKYLSRFMKQAHQVYPFDTNKVFLKKIGELPGSPSMISGVQTTFDFSLSQLVATDEENFAKGKLDLLRFIDDVVRTFVHNNEFRTEYRATVAYEWKHPGSSQCRIKEVSVAFAASVESSKTA
ncbi:unnamed protein product [Alternaria alternata]